MTKIKIVTDSTVQLTDKEINDLNITIVPLTAMIDNTIYIDGVSITKEEFLTKMNASETLPKTSQPAIGNFIDVYNELGADGSEILSLHLTEGLSGTVQAAHQAAGMTTSKVTVIDSKFIDRALAFQVIAAANLALNGASMEEILSKLTTIRSKSALYICVVNLENLIKGGRIGKTLGRISTFLNMKIMLGMKDGELYPATKGRGMKPMFKYVDHLIEEMQQAKSVVSIGISHIGGLEAIQEAVIDKLKEHFPNAQFLVEYASPSIMTHAGPGAFAIMYEVE
ncbi:DegV family protein [Isobaculum melis]|uniref:EDD domain protein, DegV family n=1 Tax=Isobaculum melis TaxID=142588 RepID=A0A1H9RTC9_9LACT|nr:DegV family protein [Isobaculum melis]SER76100.1 EDD domain protein, DegV family [Isobaculum melis]